MGACLQEAMCEADGWRLVQLNRETRETHEVFVFVLECLSTVADRSCDGGDRVFGDIAVGEVTVEQFT
jgi:hypothetical protein